MNKLLQQTMWLQGSSRHFLGPNVSALVPINILAAAFMHSHSDVSMRILHGYSDLGLIFGGFGSVVLLLLQSDVLGKLIFHFYLSPILPFLLSILGSLSMVWIFLTDHNSILCLR